MNKTFLLLFIPSLYLLATIIQPIPLHIDYNRSKVFLGQELFFDPILSRDGTVACVSCHQLPGSGAQSSAVSTGIKGQQGPINSPTVLNSRYNFKQFWDGRADTLYDQASQPIINPVEMGNSLENMLNTLENSRHYKQKFQKVYGKLSINNILDAITEFEKTLITPNSKFDKFLRQEVNLTQEESRGYQLFQNKGCISCHNGINIGGSMFQKFGAVINLGEFENNRIDNDIDLGRYNVTKRERDKHVYKVPTLRNIALTAPYFHNASAQTLEEAIQIMSLHQLGIALSKKDVHSLKIFLETLTGETPKTLLGDDINEN